MAYLDPSTRPSLSRGKLRESVLEAGSHMAPTVRSRLPWMLPSFQVVGFPHFIEFQDPLVRKSVLPTVNLSLL